MRDKNKKEDIGTPPGEKKLPRHLETFHVRMYHNIPVNNEQLLEVVFTYEQVNSGYKSLQWNFGTDMTM